MYIKPTGAPKALVIEQDISAAAGKMHVVRGPLVPASLVSLHWTADVHAPGFRYRACLSPVSLHASNMSWHRVQVWESVQDVF
jgi:hypothetical protein